jgi:AbrB family looped-hinge helix DNA binding protein
LAASPPYLSRYGRPQHPHDLGAHQCLTYTNRTKRDVWRFTHTSGEERTVTPTGALRGTSVEALLPTVLAGLAITELPEFVATQYFLDKQLEPVLTDWRLPEGGLIPKEVRAAANLKSGDRIHFTVLEDGTIIVRVKNRSIRDISFKPPGGKRVSIAQMTR